MAKWKAPVRIDLAGGWTELVRECDEFGVPTE